MGGDSNRVVALAAAISDGAGVDWAAEIEAARAAGQLDLVHGLRELAGIAEAHRSAGNETPALSSQELEATRTLTGSPEDDLQVTGQLPQDEVLLRWGALEILEKIGAGAFGEVYRAWDPRLDREVALKLLRRRESERAELESFFIKEGCLLARVRHPNVATVFGAEIHDGRVGLWMEFIRGRTLADLLREHGHFGPREAALMGLDLCRALAAVHRAGLVHRDIKAQNVMREEGGRLVLMDFGAGSDVAHNVEPDTVISGTPLYMASEVFKGAQASSRADIYSLGVLLYHLVTGSFPVNGETFRELREAHLQGKRTLLRDARPDLSEAFVQAIERAITLDPEDRFASAGQFEQALSTTLGTEPRPISVPSPRPWLTRGRLGVAAALAGALAVAIGVLQWPDPNERVPDAAKTVDEPSIEVRREPPANPADPSAVQVAKPGTGAQQMRPSPAPLDVRTTLYKLGSLYHKPLSSGDAVQPGDQLYLEIEGRDAMYVYVLNQDSMGRAYVLFPLPGLEPTNPLAAGVRHPLPGTRLELRGESEEGKRERQYWSVDTVGGKESFLIVASREPLSDLERELANVKRAELDAPLEVGSTTVARLRGIGSIAKEVPPPEGARAGKDVGETLKKLGERRTSEGGIWIEEIILDNSGG